MFTIVYLRTDVKHSEIADRKWGFPTREAAQAYLDSKPQIPNPSLNGYLAPMIVES